MDRVKIKEKAKKMIKGNLWYLWKPLVIFGLICFVVAVIPTLIAILAGAEESTVNSISSMLSTIISLVEMVFMIGFAKYCLDFVRGKKDDMKVITDFIKEHWVISFCVSLLFGLNVVIGSILLIVPGIMAAIGLCFYQEVCADNPELKATDLLRKTWKITNGHKMDLFVMGLSFIGWGILCALTIGILTIWVTPYMNIAFVLAYEELKKAD